jgi:hypothetical protein
MEELITAIGNGFGILDHLSFLPGPSDLLALAPEKVSIAAIFSGAGSVILGKFTGSVGYLTMPANYSALFIGAVLANWAFEGIRIPMVDATMQTPMILTFAGMTVSALAMLLFTRSEQY